MHTRPFGSSGLPVSEIGMGCWAIGGDAFGNSYGPTDDRESIRAVKAAMAQGCTFFDTADVYGHGHSEELLGLAVRTVRQNVWIATKVGGSYMYNNDRWGRVNFSAEYIAFALEQSLHRLQTGYVDVYQLHNPPLRMIAEGEVFRPLRELQRSGRIRFVGVSVFTLDEGIAALDHADSIQCVFNMLDPRNFELMETARRRGIAVVVREPLANGFLAGTYTATSSFALTDIRSRMPAAYRHGLAEAVADIRHGLAHRPEPLSQLALKYVLSFPCVTTVIPGAKTVTHVHENMAAAAIAPLSDSDLAVLGS